MLTVSDLCFGTMLFIVILSCGRGYRTVIPARLIQHKKRVSPVWTYAFLLLDARIITKSAGKVKAFPLKNLRFDQRTELAVDFPRGFGII